VYENGDVITGHDCKGILATISPERAIYLAQGINGYLDVRPNIYDVFKTTIKHYNLTLESVYITDLKEDTFYAKSIFKQGNDVLIIDSRPSDAMTLAVRTNSTIYINETLLDEYGIDLCEKHN
jgi:bifunctional DNase/RNase